MTLDFPLNEKVPGAPCAQEQVFVHLFVLESSCKCVPPRKSLPWLQTSPLVIGAEEEAPSLPLLTTPYAQKSQAKKPTPKSLL